MASLILKSIAKNYGAVEVIKNVDISISHGEFVVFVGPSGCGKSTLLRLIAGLEDITSGELFIGDKLSNNTEPRDRGIAMVFQSYALYPHMTVYDNVGFGLKLARAPKDERDRKIRSAAKILQMEHLLDRKPGQLSGGQRQRVAIGRAIVRQPDVFLFDEPLSNLDAALRMDMRMELSSLHQELGATMIYVTHDQVEAMTLADKIVVLNDGLVQQVGTPLDLYRHPENIFVAGFIGSPKMNLLPATVKSITKNKVVVTSRDVGDVEISLVQNEVQAGEKLTLGFRPHALTAAKNGSVLGRVNLVERLGNETIVSMSLESGTKVIASLGGSDQVEVGQELSLTANPSECLLFDASGESLMPERSSN